jgi:hypothetical protein
MFLSESIPIENQQLNSRNTGRQHLFFANFIKTVIWSAIARW